MELIEYTNDNFNLEIYNIVKNLWLYNSHNTEKTFNKEVFDKNFSEFVLSRLTLFLKQTKYFYIEPDYIETEWKDMISLHYVHTSYNFKNEVIRIHFFNKNDIKNEFYLGFITLRCINEIRGMLSFLYPNFKLINSIDEFYIIGYEKTVHLNNKELHLYTYPCLVQDGVVASCVHVNILTISNYLHEKYGMKKIRLREIDKDYTYRRAKQYPTRGLMYTQILEVFDNNRIPINSFMLLNEDKNNISIFEKYINVYIESGIPVILGAKEHVIQIIGHEIKNNKYNYIIYDDSGVFFTDIYREDKETPFLVTVSWEDIEKNISSHDFIVAPEYEKVFMSWESLLRLFVNHVECRGLSKILFESFNKKTFSNFVSRPKNYRLDNNFFMANMRMLFVENTHFKNFISEHLVSNRELSNEYKIELENIISLSKPHYFWYCELKLRDDYYLCFIADPTYSQYTTSNIFINKLPLYVDIPLSLLTCKKDLKLS